jgi:hypothetical protein
MDSRAAREERNARARLQEAWEEANDSAHPIKTMKDFLNLVSRRYLASELYEKYEDAAIEMWSQRRNPNPLTPAESTSRDSPDGKFSDSQADNLDDLPLLEEEVRQAYMLGFPKYSDMERQAGSDDAFIVIPTKAEFVHASCTRRSASGSYIRASTIRKNHLRAGEDGFIVLQWISTGPRSDLDDNTAAHTAFRVVNEEEAGRMRMKVDLVLGNDSKKELEQQAFGVHVVRRASQRLADIIEEEEPQTPALLESLPSSKQDPRSARLEAPFQPVTNNYYYGTTIFCESSNLPTIVSQFPGIGCRPAATQRAAIGVPGNAVLGPGAAEMDIPEASEGSRKKRKIADEHESRSRDRT